jgi:hypothetical protein
MRRWHGSHADPHNNRGIFFGDREFGRAVSSTFDHKIAVAPPRSIRQLCVAKMELELCPSISLTNSSPTRCAFDALSLGIAEHGWREISSIIRFESAARAAKILRWSLHSETH